MNDETDNLSPLGREEYIEQAHFFTVLTSDSSKGRLSFADQ